MRRDQIVPVGSLMVASVIIGSCIGIMAKAHADPDDLVSWAHSNGFNGTASTIVMRGSLVCADLQVGGNGEAAARDLWLNTGITDMDDARRFVIAAVDNLCVQFDHRGQAASTPAPTATDFGPVKA